MKQLGNVRTVLFGAPDFSGDLFISAILTLVDGSMGGNALLRDSVPY